MSAFDAMPKPMPPAELKDAVDALRQAVTASTATVSTPDGAVEVTAGPGNAIVGLGFGRAAYRYSPERLGALVVDTAREATAQATGSITEAVRTVRQGRHSANGRNHDGPGQSGQGDHGQYGQGGHGRSDHGHSGLDHRRSGEGGHGRQDQSHHGHSGYVQSGHTPGDRWRDGDSGDGDHRGPSLHRRRGRSDLSGPPDLPGLLGGTLPEVPQLDRPTFDDMPSDGPADDDARRADQVLRRVSEESQRQLAGYAQLRAELADLTATARSADGGVSAQVRAGGELMAVHIGNNQFQHNPATLAGIVHTTVMTATARAAMLMAERVQQLAGPRLDIRSLVESYQNPDDNPHRS
ncbi:YbaB/EbfC family nucleoid-associated protein [Asanoa sp. NPDC049518]|uniref:YbaB/EbfC family nucleoid-associated protein n=1 Tax=unclassified Asanoa TaxID=2685164 RepID=UPI00343BD451